jgi:hypothetical protein
MTEIVNEIHPELLNVCSLNSFHQNTSASRNYMFGGQHIGQALTISGGTERQIQTGLETEFGKYTFKIEMPVDGLIIDIVERYKKGLGYGSISENPETIVIYEDVHTKEIGMVRITEFCTNHQYFGFKYKPQLGLDLIRKGAHIAKGTVFMDSPAVTQDGGYKYGVQANIVYMTHPATSEDSVLISKEFLKNLAFKTYETRVVEYGSSDFALNLYGDSSNYKPFPDIGDVIREDGLLGAVRLNTPNELSIVEKGIDDTMQVDYTFDKTTYANGAGGRIVDIKQFHDISNMNYADVHMDGQLQKYDRARREFCNSIVNIWLGLKSKRGEALQMTPALHRFVVECLAVTKEGKGKRIQKNYRQEALDVHRVEFVIEYDILPDLGFKVTDTFGKINPIHG